jgi:hypothetical protein
MIAILLCIAAFGACFLAGRRSLGQGIVVLLVFGYGYGILRANLLTSFSHFIFDAGLLGLYCSFHWGAMYGRGQGAEIVRFWTVLLVLWPLLLLAMPFQPILVSLVGLRGNVFFIPLLVLGSQLRGKSLVELCVGLAVLDVVALGFGGAEYFLGVPRFFPVSPVTQIMYASKDVAGGFLRIPSTFTGAHAYGGMMVSTIPYLIGLWTTSQNRMHRMLALAGMGAAMIGVLMSATRSNFLFGCAMITIVFFTSRMNGKQRAFFMLIVAGVAVAALTNPRFQRFKTLEDKGYITERIAGSVNRGFWEILTNYPMGNGLGGGGTSIPYFLEGQVKNPIGMENEYARILAEQGILGLMLWLGFLSWFFYRGLLAFRAGPFATTRRLNWCLIAIGFGTAWIGTGLLTSIPGTALFLLGAGWVVMPPEKSPAPASPDRWRRPLEPRRKVYIPA